MDPAVKKTFEEEISKLKSQNDELEKRIRFVDYAKSAEFRTKYQEPYDKAWADAVKELSEISITDPQTGEVRAASVTDLAEVVNLPLGKARERAEELYGKFADDAMAFRKQIVGLYQAQDGALKDAQENTLKRRDEFTKLQIDTASTIKTLWDRANAEFLEKPDLAEFLKIPEADTDNTGRLKKGYELVDRAFSINSADPRLSKETREEAVRMHAAVRTRAAAFGVVRHMLVAERKKSAALEKELAQYRQTIPRPGGSSGPDTTPAQPSKGWDAIRSGLAKIARPA
jgi:hypothetical protein